MRIVPSKMASKFYQNFMAHGTWHMCYNNAMAFAMAPWHLCYNNTMGQFSYFPEYENLFLNFS